jgi:hypothetical protein
LLKIKAKMRERRLNASLSTTAGLYAYSCGRRLRYWRCGYKRPFRLSEFIS